MKITSFLFLALFAVSAEALKGQGGRQLQTCDDGQASSPQEGDCEICSKCNKENKPTSIRMRYNPAGMNSRYQMLMRSEYRSWSEFSISIETLLGDVEVSEVAM